MATILLINSDPTVQDMVQHALTDAYRLVPVHNFFSAAIQTESPDLLIVDATRPEHDALMLCHQLRSLQPLKRVPLLILVSFKTAQETAQLLDAGADLCLRKPFIGRELAARVRSLLRLTRHEVPKGLIILNTDRRTVRFGGRQIELTRTEYDLLEALCTQPGEHISTAELLEKVWHYPPGSGDPALVRNHVRNLRLKLEHDPDRPRVVTCYQGRGYAISAEIVQGGAAQYS